MRYGLYFGTVLGLFLAGELGSMVAQSEEWRSPRNANYKIWVSLDSEQKKIEGREVITWRNRMNLPTGELWFHLYYNAWINDRSTWLRENSLQPFRGTWRFAKEDWGYCTVKSIKVLAGEYCRGGGSDRTGSFCGS